VAIEVKLVVYSRCLARNFAWLLHKVRANNLGAMELK
jgi:hypothetical protein